MEERKSSFWTKAAYGSGDMYAGGAFLVVGLLYIYFLINVAGLNPALAGTVFLIGEIWDAFTDPLMGYISDRTKSKFGRRRIYFLIGIVPVFLSFALVWFPFVGTQTAMFIFYTITYLLFNAVFTMVMVPYNALLPDMIKKYSERTTYNVFRMTFSAISAIISGVLAKPIAEGFATPSQGYMIMGIIFGLIYAIPWIFVFLKTWEFPREEVETTSTSFDEVLSEFKLAFKNRAFRRHSSFFVASQTAVDFLMGLFAFYLANVLERNSEFAAVMGALLVTQLIMMNIHGRVAKRHTKTTPLKIGIGFWLVAIIIAAFIDKSSPAFIIYAVAVLCAIGTSASTFVPWSILPEVSDVDELITGRRREGVYAGMSTLIRKIANAFTGWFIGVYLNMVGYLEAEPGGEIILDQPASAVSGVRYLFVFGPLVFVILAFFMVSRYNVTEERHEMLMEEIESRKAGKGKTKDPAVIEVLEDISGVSLEEQSSFE